MKIDYRLEKPIQLAGSMPVKVDSRGMFSAVLPAEIVALLERMTAHKGVRRHDVSGKMLRDTFAGLRDEITALIKLLESEEEVSRVNVIRYQVSTACSYAMTPGGEYLPYVASGAVGGWHSGNVKRDAYNRGPYGFHVWVAPRVKITRRYAVNSEETVTYERLGHKNFPGSDDLLKDPALWLASIPSMEPLNGVEVREVPLTPEAAAFFKALLCAIMNINEKFMPMLTPDGIAKLGAADSPRLLL